MKVLQNAGAGVPLVPRVLGMWLLCAFFLASCAQEQGREEEILRIDEYYDVHGLLNRNEAMMREMEVSLRKQASFGGEQEEEIILLDSAALARELEVFRQAGINKPVLSGRYQETITEEEGLKVITYEADDKEELNINYLQVYLEPETGEVEKLEALFSNQNILYNSTRLLKVEYGEVRGEQLPLSYTIDGVQKMIFSDKEEYRVEGEFIYQ